VEGSVVSFNLPLLDSFRVPLEVIQGRASHNLAGSFTVSRRTSARTSPQNERSSAERIAGLERSARL